MVVPIRFVYSFGRGAARAAADFFGSEGLAEGEGECMFLYSLNRPAWIRLQCLFLKKKTGSCGSAAHACSFR